MKHPALLHLRKLDRWDCVQRFNKTWVATVGFFLFIGVGMMALLGGSMLMVGLGITRGIGRDSGPLLSAIAAVPAIALGACAWEAFRRVMVNRALDRGLSHHCARCGYDLGINERLQRCPECGQGEKGTDV